MGSAEVGALGLAARSATARQVNAQVVLRQAQIAVPDRTTPQNITQHVRSIYAEGEQLPEATCKDYLQVRTEGSRQVSREVKHYDLAMILAVGFRVRCPVGTRFRQWATTRNGSADYWLCNIVVVTSDRWTIRRLSSSQDVRR